MAVIDLKNATIYIRDGYGNAGAVNLLAGYAAGLATIALDGVVGIIPNGTRVQFAGHDTIYVTTAHTETSSNTTGITFAPVLTDPLVDNEVITFLPNQIEVNLGDGNLTWQEKVTREYLKNKGLLDTVRDGDQEQVTLSLDARWDHLRGSSGDAVLPNEAIKHIGNAAAWVSSSDDPCEPYAVDIVVEYQPPCDDEDLEVITFEDFRYETADFDLRAGTISFKGAANVTMPTIERVSA
jgi:hypothetical protein